MRVSSADQLREDLGSGIGPIAQVVPELRAVIPDAPPPIDLDPQQARFRFFDSLTDYLDRLSTRQPLVLVIDDLQWADPSSVLLLEFVADHIATQHLLLLGTYRMGEAYQTRAITQALERIGRSQAIHRVQLQGLEPDATAQLGSLVAGQDLPPELSNSIQQRTDGNPLFVRELARLLAEEQRDQIPSHPGRWGSVVPIAVRDAVNLRAEHLSEAARRVLVIASVIGSAFSIDVLATVAELTIDDLLDLLDEAVTYRLVMSDLEDVSRFRFSHGLIQEAIQSGLIGARKARLHARIGEALVRLRGSGADPPFAEIAWHFVQAAAIGKADDAIDYSIRAGEQAMVRLAYTEAATQFQQVVELVDRYQSDRSTELADALLQLGRAQMAAGEPAAAHATLLHLISLARNLKDAERAATAAIELSGAAEARLEFFALDDVRVLQDVLRLLPHEDSVNRARLMSRLAYLKAMTNFMEPDNLRELSHKWLAENAIAMARRLGDPAALTDALRAGLESLTTAEDPERRLAIATEMLTLSGVTGNRSTELLAHAARAGAYLILGRVTEADEELIAYQTVATTLGLIFNQWSVSTKLAMRTFMRGDLTRAANEIERSRVIGMQGVVELTIVTHHWQLFFLRREQGRLHELEDSTRSAAAEQPDFVFSQCMLATFYSELGYRAEASQIVKTLLDGNMSLMHRDNFWLASLALLSEVVAALNDSRHAADLLALLAPHKRLFISPANRVVFFGPVSHYLGILASTLERWNESASYFDDALQKERHTNTPVLEVYTECAYATLLATALDRVDDAIQLLDKAASTTSQLGLVRGARAVNAVRTAIRVSVETCRSPRPSTTQTPAGSALCN